MTDRSASAVVDRLIAAWEARDVDAIAACLAPDAVWHNMPHAPIIGRDAIAAAIGRFLADMVAVDFRILHAGEIGPRIVMNERVDSFTRRDGTRLVIPVAGVFEVEHGAVRSWRDYFDAAQAGA